MNYQDLLNDYIHGDKFVQICDYKIDTNDFQINREYLRRNQLVYIKTDKILDFFDIVRDLPYRYVILTHNSDHNITENIYEQKPGNVVHWFAQNCLVKKNDVTPIPIGLERPGVGRSGDIGCLKSTWKDLNKTNEYFCYANFSPSTNPQERSINLNHEWITSEQNIPFNYFISQIYSSKFVLSPPGNGHDCHRTWETLYMGAYPVVKSSPASRYFRDVLDLPLILYDDPSQITKEFLYQELSKHEIFSVYPLKMEFWKKQIEKVINDLL